MILFISSRRFLPDDRRLQQFFIYFLKVARTSSGGALAQSVMSLLIEQVLLLVLLAAQVGPAVEKKSKGEVELKDLLSDWPALSAQLFSSHSAAVDVKPATMIIALTANPRYTPA